MQFVDAQHNAAEVLQGRLSLPGLVEPSQSPIEAVVDEATGEVEQEVAFHGRTRTLDVEAIVQDTVEDGLTDEVVIFGLGANVRRTGAKRLAAATACGVLCVEDVQPEDVAVGQRTREAVEATFAAAVTTAAGAGVGLGLATDRDNLLTWSRFDAHGLRSWITEVRDRCSRTQAFFVNRCSCLRHFPMPPSV